MVSHNVLLMRGDAAGVDVERVATASAVHGQRREVLVGSGVAPRISLRILDREGHNIEPRGWNIEGQNSK